jgi:MFS transporter, DHA2 family, methylenomycin A resistance protein
MRSTRAATHGTQRLTLVTTCLTVLLVQLDTTVVNVALHAIQASLGASVAILQWLVDAYNVVYASLILTGGTLGDLFGRRRWWAIGVATFCAGSLACAFAPSAPVLVAGRAVAGLGAALALPGSLAVLSVAYPEPGPRARAVSIWAGVNGVAIALGPALGGLLVDRFGWRSIFLVVVPVAAGALLLAGRVRESADRVGRRLDVPGQLLAIAGLGLLAAGAIEGQSRGWLSPPILGCLLGSAVALAAFVAVERGARSPLVPLDVFGNRAFSGALVVAMAMTFGMYGMLFLVPLYLQSALGLSATAAGLSLVPMGVVFAVVSPCAGRLAAAFGPRLLIGGGMGLSALGLATLSRLEGGVAQLLPSLAVIGLALGLQTGPLMAVAVASVPPARAGMASGLVNVGRMLGATLGVAVLGSVFAVASRGGQTGDQLVAGAHVALLVGAAAELVGCVVALSTIGSRALAGTMHTSEMTEARRRYA